MEQPSDPTLTEFITYNNWANQMLLQACQKLNEDQLARHIPGAYGSIRDALEHIVRSEAAYVRLLTSEPPRPGFKWDAKPNLAEMTAYAVEVANGLEATVQHVPPTAQIDQEIDGKLLHFRALAVFIQIIGHGIEHRTNITTILNQGMQTPPVVDGREYLLTHLDRLEQKRA
jgi:uncharacterized damage-inducible protein DinB